MKRAGWALLATGLAASAAFGAGADCADDREPPRLEVRSLSNMSVTNDPDLAVEIRATDACGVGEVVVSHRKPDGTESRFRSLVGKNSRDATVSQPLVLSPGKNRVRFSAVDASPGRNASPERELCVIYLASKEAPQAVSQPLAGPPLPGLQGPRAPAARPPAGGTMSVSRGSFRIGGYKGFYPNTTVTVTVRNLPQGSVTRTLRVDAYGRMETVSIPYEIKVVAGAFSVLTPSIEVVGLRVGNTDLNLHGAAYHPPK